MKDKYEKTHIEIIEFTTEDVILTSDRRSLYEGWNPGDPGSSAGSGGYEGWMPH